MQKSFGKKINNNVGSLQEVFNDDNKIDGSNFADYNSIKDAVHSKLRN